MSEWAKYPADPEFPDACGTHADTLRAARGQTGMNVMHEFRRAKKDRWAEWVAARTPFGEEAQSLVDWYEGQFVRQVSKEERAAKEKEIADLVIKIDQFFYPPDTRPESKKMVGYALNFIREVFSPELVIYLIALSCAAAFGIRNPFHWPLYGQIIGALFVAWAVAQTAFSLVMYVFSHHPMRQRIPGYVERKRTR